MDFEAAGLLNGLEGEDREARQRLLARLAEDGVELAELKAAVAEERLALLPVERVLGGTHTAREIERETGVPAELILRIRRLSGLPETGADERAFSAEDLEAAKSIKVFLDAGFDQEAFAQMTRVLGESMARLAATVTASFADTFLSPGDTEEDVAFRFAGLAEELTPALTPVLLAGFKAHLHESVSRGMLGRAERESGQVAGAQHLGVCFADLVGFTRLGGQMEVEDLGQVAGNLAELASETARPPVRLVKTIGDAAMFVSSDMAALVDAALSLVQATEEADLPALRAGIACGDAITRAGDYYGNPVNIASRVTGIARAGSVLCTEEVRDAAADRFEWSYARKHRIKGVEDLMPLYRARRLPAGSQDGAGAREEAKKPKAGRRRKRASR